MPIKTDSREYRSAAQFRALDADESGYIVEGYATTFNDPYLMGSYDGVDYYEQIDARAFDGADMTDVILQYDHSGMVYARQKNGTLELNVDEHGLHVRADLGSTPASRELYEAIKTGLVSEMSFAFTVESDNFNSDNHTRTINRIKKVFDVSAVSIPANPSTEISARSFIDGVIARETAERQAAEELAHRKAKIRLLAEL